MVKIPAVLDCACLIGLERIGRLDLLPALLEPAFAPPAVITEFDRKAREAAQRLGIPITGTIGLLLKAKQNGLVPAIKPLLDALDEQHFRIGFALREEALRLAGE